MSGAEGSMVDDKPWWRSAAVYQIYLRSFADGDGDGVGDIAGIRSRLAYLADLGIDAIWINPWYPSPLHDGGYDIVDYRDINPLYGTLDEADCLIGEAQALGIKVLIDIVPNHTSNEHQWFQEALKATPGHPARDRYLFRDGRGKDGTEPPNNWKSVFGGSAWERVGDGQWYLHLFDVSQPDLNWENAEVRREFEEILRFWLDRGVDGFRVDVAHGLFKDLTFPDIEEQGDLSLPRQQLDHPFWDRDEVHEIYRGWRSILNEYGDRMMVAEAWVHPDRLPLYIREDEYNQSFNWDFLAAEWNAAGMARVITESYEAAYKVGASPTWVLSNHDVMRHSTRYGLPSGTDWRAWPLDGPHGALDAELGARRARAAALILLSLPGSAYLYQGEELGLPEVWDLPETVLDDPMWERSGGTSKGRDGCRVPLPWESEGPSLGFSATEPWMPQPGAFAGFAGSDQAHDSESSLLLYRQALALRRKLLVADEEIELIDLGPEVLAYRRGSGIACVVNMGVNNLFLPDGEVILTSVPLSGGRLPQDAAAWISLASN